MRSYGQGCFNHTCVHESVHVYIFILVLCVCLYGIYMGPPHAKLAEGSVNFGV